MPEPPLVDGTFVSVKEAASVRPATVAVTGYDPATALAVRVDAVAIPFTSVAAVVDVVPSAKVTLAPLNGLLNVTSSFAIGTPDESVTVACRFAEKGVETVADCPPPALAVTDAGDSVTVRSAAALVTLPALFVTVTV
jgi:hypothetical protein